MGAQGSQAGISFIAEVAWGTAPVAQFAGVNFTSEDMSMALDKQVSDTVRPDRQTAGLIAVGAETSGGFETEFQAHNLDGLLPGFFMVADWTLDVIQNGVVRSSYSVERSHNDVGQFFLYKGMTPNTMDLSIESGSPVMCNLAFVGKDEILGQVTHSTPAATATVTDPLMSSATSIGAITIGGVAAPSCLIQKLAVKLDNQVEGKTGVGVLGFCDANAKSLLVTGEISLYFEDESYYDDYLASTPFGLVIPMTDSDGNSYTLELPACEFDEMTANVSGKDADVMLEGSFTAYMGAGGWTIQLTRSLV